MKNLRPGQLLLVAPLGLAVAAFLYWAVVGRSLAAALLAAISAAIPGVMVFSIPAWIDAASRIGPRTSRDVVERRGKAIRGGLLALMTPVAGYIVWFVMCASRTPSPSVIILLPICMLGLAAMTAGLFVLRRRWRELKEAGNREM